MDKPTDGNVIERTVSEQQTVNQDDQPATIQLYERLLLPLASESDAERTCEELWSYIDEQNSQLFVVHVIEKTEGYPDKAPYDVRKEQADAIFDIVHEHFADTVHHVSTEIRYGSNAVEEIFAAADTVDATAIGFTPQPGRRWIRILAGDAMYKLVTTSRRPIIVLPPPNNQT